NGEDPELEAPATFRGESGGRGGSGAGSSGYIPGRIRGTGTDPELEAPATFRGESGDGKVGSRSYVFVK
ncbi:MAG: hypothetical protein WCT05_08500, partial [Lentisphaeria bacterium]